MALGVSEQAVRQAIARGALAAAKRGRTWQIRQEELDRYAQHRHGRHLTLPGGSIVALPTQAPVPPPPVPAARFVGREADLAALVELMQDSAERVVTLTGPGGVGKTRLALAAARIVVDRFPDGVHFVDLAAVSRPQMLFPTIATSLALREQPGRGLGVQLAAYLRGRRMLLILDNFEQIVEAAPDVAWLGAHAPELTVLITSRAPLRIGGERQLRVPPLSLAVEGADVVALLASDAGRLFVERAREHDPGFAVDDASAPMIADLCARLDGLPLAIELAAAWVKVLPLPQLRGRLQPRLPLLARGARDAPARQTTMRDAIAWSYDLLTPDQRRGFRNVSMFAGGFTLAAAEAIWSGQSRRDSDNLDGAGTISLLGALVDQSLLISEPRLPGEPRFRMLETIREFGQAQLESGEMEELCAAHARHYLHLATTLRPLVETLAVEEPIDRLAADDANVMQALTWLDEGGHGAAVASMVAACKTYWYAVGRLSEAERWITRAQATIGQAVPSDRALLAIALGELRLVNGDFTGAEQLLSEGTALMREVSGPLDLTMGLTAFAAALNYGGNYVLAEDHLHEALAVAGKIADETLRAAFTSDVFHNLSVSARGKGDLDLAAAYCDRALGQLHGRSLALAEHRVQMTICGIAKDRGDLPDAVAGYQSLLGQINEQGETWVAAAALAGIAHAATAWAQPRDALLLFGAADALRERCGTGLILPAEAVQEDRNRQSLRAAMSDREVEATLAEGRGMSLPGAIAVALAVNGPVRQARPRATVGEPLTRREREVLGLLARGLTDREIAADLYLSARTVNWHVRAILAKLNVATRRAAANKAQSQAAIGSDHVRG